MYVMRIYFLFFVAVVVILFVRIVFIEIHGYRIWRYGGCNVYIERKAEAFNLINGFDMFFGLEKVIFFSSNFSFPDFIFSVNVNFLLFSGFFLLHQ